MTTVRTDPIIAEIRAVREAHASRFGYDVRAIFRDLQARQAASGRSYERRLSKEVKPHGVPSRDDRERAQGNA